MASFNLHEPSEVSPVIVILWTKTQRLRWKIDASISSYNWSAEELEFKGRSIMSPQFNVFSFDASKRRG